MAHPPTDLSTHTEPIRARIAQRRETRTYRGAPRPAELWAAAVGDLFMSLIHTCELAGANPFDYLTTLQRHRDAVAATPAARLPSAFRETLAALTSAE